MDTIKTAAVVALLLAVLYGIYVVLNHEEPAPPPEVAEMMKDLDDDLLQPPDIESGTTSGPTAPANAAVSQAAPAGEAGSKPSDTGQPRIFVQVEPPDQSPSPAPQLPPTAPAIASTAPPRTEAVTAPPGTPIVPPPTKLPPVEETAGNPPASKYSLPATAVPQGHARDGGPGAVAPRGSASSGSEVVKPDSYPNPALQSGDRFSAAGEKQGAPNGFAVSSKGLENSAWPPSAEPQPPSGAGAASAGASRQPAPNNPAVLGNFSSSTAEASAAHERLGARSGIAGPAGVAAPSLSAAVQEAKSLISARKYREALETLSVAYAAHHATADSADRQAALDLLDPLAAAVIYSRHHWLEPAYKVKVGESLEDIAASYQVPWQLLRNINGIGDPESLVPGRELKVVRGPFRAVVELTRSELTMYLNHLYAGRFPIAVGSDPSPPPGDYLVVNKQEGRTYYAADGRTIPPYDPQNPYGGAWLDLGANGVCIHGSPRAGGPGISTGCISLSPKDATDVLAILSIGSRVSIRP